MHCIPPGFTLLGCDSSNLNLAVEFNATIVSLSLALDPCAPERTTRIQMLSRMADKKCCMWFGRLMGNHVANKPVAGDREYDFQQKRRAVLIVGSVTHG